FARTAPRPLVPDPQGPAEGGREPFLTGTSSHGDDAGLLGDVRIAVVDRANNLCTEAPCGLAGMGDAGDGKLPNGPAGMAEPGTQGRYDLRADPVDGLAGRADQHHVFLTDPCFHGPGG